MRFPIHKQFRGSVTRIILPIGYFSNTILRKKKTTQEPPRKQKLIKCFKLTYVQIFARVSI